MLLISPLDRGPIVYWTATLWALLFGALTLGTTLRDRVRAQRQDEESEQQTETDSVTTK
jgi:cytochrome c-type biogenesis protein CcmH/NrfF